MVTCKAVVEGENLFVWQQVEGFGTDKCKFGIKAWSVKW